MPTMYICMAATGSQQPFAGPDLPVPFVLFRIGVYSGVPDRVYRQLSPSWRTSPENYSAEGNHLLFEAQRMVYAGVFFPELKDAAIWRESGINILNREIKKQVYNDGGQYELDPHYHLAAINIFCKALRMADCNGFRNEFPSEYLDTVKNMIAFYANICFPTTPTLVSVMPSWAIIRQNLPTTAIGLHCSPTAIGYVIMRQKGVKALLSLIFPTGH